MVPMQNFFMINPTIIHCLSTLHPHIVGFTRDYPIIGSYDAPPPSLCGPQCFGASEAVECQLS